MKQFLRAKKPFFGFTQTSGNSLWLSIRQRRGGQRCSPGDSQMRIFSFVLAFAFILAGPTLAGPSEAGLLGIGTFAYNGSPVISSQVTVVAAR
jgi:hypothetical protein